MEQRRQDRQWWPLWGVAAGLLGFIGHAITQAPVEVYERTSEGDAIIGLLSRGPYHVGVVCGLAAAMSVLLLAGGWRRWSAGSPSLVAAALPGGLVAGAGAMLMGYGVKGSMAIYLPGGINAGEYPPEALYVLWMVDDLGAWTAWWGVVAAAMALTWLALRERVLPRSIGVLAVLGWLPPLGFLVVTGLPGFPGIAGPFWLVLTSVVMAVTRWPTSAAEAAVDPRRAAHLGA